MRIRVAQRVEQRRNNFRSQIFPGDLETNTEILTLRVRMTNEVVSGSGCVMKLNVLNLSGFARLRTHEGAPAVRVTPELALRRSVLACMLWEDEFYEDGVAIAGRVRELVPKVDAAKVAALAVEARTAMKLRHAPLLLVREMARHATHRALVAETMTRVIQ